jgi:prepilin-type N-terminal cleavage/methylation domain-containing protein
VRARPGPPRRRRPGFTLIEVGVVLFVVALLAGVAIPALSNVTGVQARGEVSKLAANIRASRGTAAVSGKTCRMAIDIDSNSYRVECADGMVRVAKERSRNRARDEDDEDGPVDLARLSEKERARLELLKKAQFAESPTLRSQTLSGGLEFASVWVSHQEEAYEKGKAYLYFFPSGMGQRGNIQLRRGDEYYSLHVSSLAGRVRIFNEKKELPGILED